MTRESILDQLANIIREVLDNDSLSVTPESTADEVDGWDSIAQVQILIATEKAFGIRLDIVEVNSLPNVGALMETIYRKLNR